MGEWGFGSGFLPAAILVWAAITQIAVLVMFVLNRRLTVLVQRMTAALKASNKMIKLLTENKK
jgi:hypothetical protein